MPDYSSCRITLVAGLVARIQYPEGPATGHLDKGFPPFPCVYKQMLRRFSRFQVATTCFPCSPPNLNFLDPYFLFMYTSMHNNHCHRATAHLQLNILLLLSSSSSSSIISLLKKGKAVPLQAWSGPEGSRKLRFLYFMTTAQDGGKVVSLTHRPSLPPGNAPGTHFY